MGIIRWLFIVSLSLGCGLVDAKVAPWVDFRIVGGFVVIPSEIQGIKGYSVIDTGARVTGIEQSFVKQHNLKFPVTRPMKIIGVNGSEMRKVYQNVPVTLMGTELVFKRVVDLGLDPRAQMLIGADFLSGLYFQFDYPNKRLRAISRDTFNLKKISNVKSKRDPVSGQPMIKVRLNDEHDSWLVMDTGNAGGIVMKRGPAKKWKWLEKFSADQATSRGAITTAGIEVFRMPLIEIGPFNVKNARVAVPIEGQRLHMFKSERARSDRRRKIQGLLGYDVLKNFLVTFDYQSGAVFIELPKPVGSN